MDMDDTATCGSCRHANHGTMDAAEGLLACPWFGATYADSSCRVRLRDTGQMAFEAWDGSNGTWGGAGGPLRAPPRGYEGRAVEVEDDGSPPLELDLSL